MRTCEQQREVFLEGLIVRDGSEPERASRGLCATGEVPWLARPPAPGTRSHWTYMSHALLHPCHLLVAASMLFLSLLCWSGLLLFVTLGFEALFLGLVPRLLVFRHHVDKVCELAELAAAQKAREALVAQMDHIHRNELTRLEILVNKTRENVLRKGGTIDLFDDIFGLGRLTTNYIRLAIAQKASKECLAMTNRQALQDTIRSLEALLRSCPERMRRPIERRLAIAYRRAQCWDRTREHVEMLTHQLATVMELVGLLHDQSTAPASAQEMFDELEEAMSDLEDNEGLLRELAELGGGDVVVQDQLQAMATPRRSLF